MKSYNRILSLLSDEKGRQHKQLETATYYFVGFNTNFPTIKLIWNINLVYQETIKSTHADNKDWTSIANAKATGLPGKKKNWCSCKQKLPKFWADIRLCVRYQIRNQRSCKMIIKCLKRITMLIIAQWKATLQNKMTKQINTYLKEADYAAHDLDKSPQKKL